MRPPRRIGQLALLASLLLATACSSSDGAEVIATATSATSVPQATAPEIAATTEPVSTPVTTATDANIPADDAAEPAQEQPTTEADPVDQAETQDTGTQDTEVQSTATFTAEIWADNWFALYVNGSLVGEDSVPITTERSFNSETFSFEATTPLTIAVEAKDFKETDSGIEYIGLNNQQMGDGGFIMQVTNLDTGELVVSSSSEWSALVIHRAPLNTACERDADPDSTCQFEATDAPANWTAVNFDDSAWDAATEWSESAVSPKDGYDQISWNDAAKLIWGSDLEVDNTVLFRNTTPG